MSNNETPADIACEMRDGIADLPWGAGYVSELAARIEAAAKREREIMRGLVAILETITLEDHEIELLDEAREALGEDKP